MTAFGTLKKAVSGSSKLDDSGLVASMSEEASSIQGLISRYEALAKQETRTTRVSIRLEGWLGRHQRRNQCRNWVLGDI